MDLNGSKPYNDLRKWTKSLFWLAERFNRRTRS